MPSTTHNMLLLLMLLLAAPFGVRSQLACSLAEDGSLGSDLCNCFYSQEPVGWVVECNDLQLTEVPSGIPSETMFLMLNGNQIASLPATAFQGLNSLQTIQIQNNLLSDDQISEGVFAGLKNLTTLDLTGNMIALSENMVSHLLSLTRLATLTLPSNNINTIHSSAVTVFDRLTMLDVTSNPFICDCPLAWFRNWLYNTQDSSPREIMGATCDSPAHYQRTDITAAGFCPSTQCYSCSDASSDADCSAQLIHFERCSASKGACQNEIRVTDGVYTITKQCMQVRACLAQVANNPNDCSSDSTVNSVCRICCQGDLCNGPASGVLENYTIPGYPRDPNLPIPVSTTLTPLPTNGPTTVTPTGGSSTTSVPPIGTTLLPIGPTSTSLSTRGTTRVSTTEPTTPPPSCPAETTSNTFGRVTWVQTPVGETARAECPYGYVNKSSAAQRMPERQCRLVGRNMAVWTGPNFNSCASSSMVLRKLSDVTITTGNAQNVSASLMMVTGVPDALIEEDVELTVDILEHLADFVNASADDSVAVVVNAMETVSSIADARMDVLVAGQQDTASATRILELIDAFALGVKFEDMMLEVTTTKVDIVVLQIDNETVIDGVSFRSSSNGDATGKSELLVNTTGLVTTSRVQAMLELPPSLFAARRGEIDRVQFVLYKDTIFYQVIKAAVENTTSSLAPTTVSSPSNEDIAEREALNSLVISASVGDLKISGLADPVRTSFAHQRPERAENASCVFWDVSAADGQGSWSSEGCQVSVSTEGSTQCECNHLTNFALLMDIYGNTDDISPGHDLALSIITYVGCALSVFGLICTFLSYITIRTVKKAANRKRQLRNDRRSRVLLNLVVALILMNVTFIVDSALSEFGDPGDVQCKVLGGLLHYALLAAVTWMALEAWHMYLALVIVFDSYTSHLMKKMAIIGWGLPLIIVGVTLGIDRGHYDYHSGFCWLEVTSIPFYVSFIAPVIAMLIFNSIIFGIVTHQLCSLRRRSLSTSTEKFDASAQLRASLSITVLLGLTWGLAIFNIGEASVVFTYLFAIFNSMQGFTIFVFHCLLNEEVRISWISIMCPQFLSLEELTKSSSGGIGNHFSSAKQAKWKKRRTMEFSENSLNRLSGNSAHLEGLAPYDENSKFNPFATNMSKVYQVADTESRI